MTEDTNMSSITGLTRGGAIWIPSFLVSLNHKTCIGCGRCYKVCSRDVLELVERADLEEDDDDDGDGFSDDVAMVMSLKNAADCIGCESCARVCPKKTMTHAPQAAA